MKQYQVAFLCRNNTKRYQIYVRTGSDAIASSVATLLDLFKTQYLAAEIRELGEN